MGVINMANKYTFSERYKKELVDIEIKFSDEEKNYYEDLLKYDESVSVGILGTERYQKNLLIMQQCILQKRQTENYLNM